MNTDDLEKELRRESRNIRIEPPPGLASRISAAVHATAADNAAPPRLFAGISFVRSWALWTGIGGVAAAAIVAAWVINRPAAQVDNRAEAAALAQEIKGVPRQVWVAVEPRTAAILQQDPLREETKALASDANSALGFLKYNFLPGVDG